MSQRQRLSAASTTAAANPDYDEVRRALDLTDPDRPQPIPLKKMRRDGGTQPRAALNETVMHEYAEAMQEGRKLPPVTVFFDGTDYWLSDGFHRVGAAELNGYADYPAIVRQGTQRDAILFSCGVNDEHGLRRTNEDKRRAVMTLLQDKEWGSKSSNFIASACKVSHTFVDNVRRSLATVAGERTHGEKFSEKRVGVDGREIKIGGIQKAAQKRAAKSSKSFKTAEEIPAVMNEIALIGKITDQVLIALRQNDLAFSDLLRVVKQGVGQEFAPTLLSSVLRDMSKANLIAPSTQLQAAFTLGTATPETAATARPAAGGRPLPKATGENDQADREVETLRKILKEIMSLNDALFQTAVERLDVVAVQQLFELVQAAYFKLEDIGRWLEIEVKE